MFDRQYLISLINSYPADIKAEVIVADLLQSGFTQADFIVFFESLFKRRYSKDVLGAKIISKENGDDLLAIYLARDGLYDLLPEGLFHESPHSALKSGRDMAMDSRKESKVEQEARKFFRPIENEFFYHRVLIEKEERSLLKKFHDSNLDDFFQRFWNIDPSLPHDLTVKMVAYLPFVKEIVGDYRMTAHCLGSILNEPVTFESTYPAPTSDIIKKNNDEEGFSLGRANLGVNFITAGNAFERHKLIRFTIGPLKNTRIESFLEGGQVERFLEYFSGYFLPLEVDYSFEVVMERGPDGFILEQEENQPVMGYNTVI